MQVIQADMTRLGYIIPYNLHKTYITNNIHVFTFDELIRVWRLMDHYNDKRKTLSDQ